MRDLVFVAFMSLIIGIWQQVAPGPQVLHPLEVRRDQLMEMRYTKTLQALREKDNKKTIAMLREVKKEFVAGMELLKPEYERWVNSLSVKEIEQLMERLHDKKYFDLIVELQTDVAIMNRYLNNEEIYREYRALEISCDRAITF